ncbi:MULTISPECIES: D-ribose ABC transporter substrate-binding protein [Corynebacterium]|uniref:D-ribose ABC transporter substrate-binding protein n=1 Tax=Corynebacterium TaxID=1716 RepID=UPI000839C862|nr:MULTISPECIES: D-ribose ABC transporter substrate-binding protein [Corynebacterium]MBF9012238.1 D-ribose ABC transporter substrate-binding protein [Corynebacterium phoceense]MCQ9331794.1 D-ribose ABC transporter substrate-binding protein [Corynebacterium phoceense]OFN42347.1 D-ribose ABC transporter substrate-binding protein [Corynebacterium sp. HMSC072G08]OFP66431.1 D-ribose ABC transporter substrate-binding protein [Corynebacterium sp. HMSC077D10]
MSIFRKSLAVVSISAVALGAAACNRGESGSSDSVTLALSTQTNPFFVELRDGAQAKADELGIKLDIQDASDDASKQADQLKNAETSGAGVVIVNPTDSDAVGSAVQALNSANIPVIAVDRSSNSGEVASYVASDNVAGGKQAAEALAKAIGDEGEILVLQGIAGSSASRDRGEGFREGIKAHPKIKIVAEQTAKFDRTEGLNVTTNLLQAHPNVKAIFAENDEMALGAIEALGAKAGKDVKVFGFDGTEDGIAAIEKGTMNGTIAQQPEELGAKAVEQASALLKGESAQAEVPVEVVTVDSSNVAEFK